MSVGRHRRGPRTTCAALLGATLAGGCGGGTEPPAAADAAAAEYVGGAVCGACHAEQTALWSGSHHAFAMQPATEPAVRGDFASTVAVEQGSSWTFYRDGAQFLARADEPRGRARELTITHTFGIEPLQQYLVPQPGGRLQALGFAWDTRPAGEGGQRWFHLYPEAAADPGHPLHWTGGAQNWNAACAYCHSTNLRMGYDPESDTFATTWSSVNVDCEACHGPGSLHAADPSVPLALGPAAREWLPTDGRAAVLADGDRSRRDVETAVCGSCHARRVQLTENYRPGEPLLDHFRPALLTADLYHADGQIDDEVFEYGSFLQSAMYAAGVTCTDCHEPHGGRLRRAGNALCTGCHAAASFDAASHHRHAPGEPGSRCVECHMPAQTYMMVDERRDHGFRIPRPALSAAIGSLQPCAQCHDEGDAWAAEVIARWFPGGRQREPHFGTALHAGRTWAADRDRLLRELAANAQAPAIARATALRLLAAVPDATTLDAAAPLLRDSDPLVQLEALGILAGAANRDRIQLGQRFLDHPLRAVRIEAARVLAPARAELTAARRAGLDRALAEYFAAEGLRQHGAAGFYNSALVRAALGEHAAAIADLERALVRDPEFAPAYVNLAELVRARGDDAAAERVLRDGLALLPQDAGLHYALGLALIRAERRADGDAELAAATTLAPHEPLYAYAHALAVAAADADAGVAALEAVSRRFPGYRPALFAQATLHRDAGRAGQARALAERILEMAPGDAAARALLAELERG